MMNLADLIVDIVDTGNTLAANGMEPLEENRQCQLSPDREQGGHALAL